MSNTIKIKRGLEADLPLAGVEAGELKYAIDTNKLFIGTGTENKALSSDAIVHVVELPTENFDKNVLYALDEDEEGGEEHKKGLYFYDTVAEKFVRIADTDYVDEAVQSAGRGFKFVGFISPNEPTENLKKGMLWYNSTEITMPTIFPIQVKEYDGETWSEETKDYTPESMELWSNKNNDHGYYWFGDKWNGIDMSYENLETTLELDTTTKTDKDTLKVKVESEDGSVLVDEELDVDKVIIPVTEFPTEPNKERVYHLTEDILNDDESVKYAKGYYVYDKQAQPPAPPIGYMEAIAFQDNDTALNEVMSIMGDPSTVDYDFYINKYKIPNIGDKAIIACGKIIDRPLYNPETYEQDGSFKSISGLWTITRIDETDPSSYNRKLLASDFPLPYNRSQVTFEPWYPTDIFHDGDKFVDYQDSTKLYLFNHVPQNNNFFISYTGNGTTSSNSGATPSNDEALEWKRIDVEGIDKFQGVENKDKILKVNTEGYLELTDTIDGGTF